jgi:hypothetical protein
VIRQPVDERLAAASEEKTRRGLDPRDANWLCSAAADLGWILGGAAGVGTVVSVALIGLAVDASFSALRVDPAGRRSIPIGPS